VNGPSRLVRDGAASTVLGLRTPVPRRCLLDFSVPKAAGTNPHSLYLAVNEGTNPMKIRLPLAIGYVMRVTDTSSGYRMLIADVATSCHGTILLYSAMAEGRRG